MEWLLEMLQGFSKVTHAHLELAEVGVDLRGHNVTWPKYFQAAVDRALEQEVRVLHIFLWYMKVCHDVIYGNLHRVIIAPMIV